MSVSDLKLLYIEDDDETRENYAFMLKDYFAKIHLAKDGIEGMHGYYEANPDILLVDINIPFLNGLDLVKTIRESNPTISIIVLTAYSNIENLLNAVNLKLDAYLVKPVDDYKLKNIIIKQIKQIQERKQIRLGRGMIWDKNNSVLMCMENQIKLTKKERLLMEILINAVDKFFSKDTLILHIWEDEVPDESHDNKLIQLIYRLNKKVSSYTNHADPLIENSYASGYRVCSTF